MHLAMMSQCACVKGAGLRWRVLLFCQTWQIMGLRTVRGTHHPLVKFWLELSCWWLPWGFSWNRVMAVIPRSQSPIQEFSPFLVSRKNRTWLASQLVQRLVLRSSKYDFQVMLKLPKNYYWHSFPAVPTLGWGWQLDLLPVAYLLPLTHPGALPESVLR